MTSNDLTGRRFGRLLIMGLGEKTLHGSRRWLCQCDCGQRSLQTTNALRVVVSCGCRKAEHAATLAAYRKPKERKPKPPLYSSWCSMRARCGNPRHPDFPRYGARGIRVCERWQGRGGFAAFVADVGERPSPAHSLDRINNDGNYEPGNVRWATRLEQARNTSRTRLTPAFRAEAEKMRALGLTNTKIASALGVHRATVSHALAPKRFEPGLASMLMFAGAV